MPSCQLVAPVAVIDVETTHADAQRVSFGGRLMIRTHDTGCLFCYDLLDQADIRATLTPPERRAEEDAMYGVDRDALGQRGPSVACLNGVVASLAVTEFLVFVTKIARAPQVLLRYDGIRGSSIAHRTGNARAARIAPNAESAMRPTGSGTCAGASAAGCGNYDS